MRLSTLSRGSDTVSRPVLRQRATNRPALCHVMSERQLPRLLPGKETPAPRFGGWRWSDRLHDGRAARRVRLIDSSAAWGNETEVSVKRVPRAPAKQTLINSKILSSVERPETTTSCIAYIYFYHRVQNCAASVRRVLEVNPHQRSIDESVRVRIHGFIRISKRSVGESLVSHHSDPQTLTHLGRKREQHAPRERFPPFIRICP